MRTKKDGAVAAKKRQGALGAFLMGGLLAFGGANAGLYDFEELSLISLNGQDGWLSEPSLGEALIQVDGTLANGTQVARPNLGVATGFPAHLSRVNNGSFGFSPFFGTETQAVIQFDANGEAMAGFALGRDVDGDGILRRSGEVGPVFGTVRDPVQGVEQFGILAADQSSYHVTPLTAGDRCCNAATDWYRLQLRMDLTANGGAGSGGLYYMNLTTGDTSFKPVTELQNINLRLDAMHPEAGPQAWNAMWMVMLADGKQHLPAVDNLVPRSLNVVQANMDIHLSGVDGLVAFGGKFDVILQWKEKTDGEYYWVLKHYEEVDPSTPSASAVLSNLDLVVEELDATAPYPTIGLMHDLHFEYQGPDTDAPFAMLWKLLQ
ncbi:MAG: hypothetical protein U9Q81_27460 [Pseudomonadota bacterium]|nr:hypothetical protein [Pseudomonadota bacterium]